MSFTIVNGAEASITNFSTGVEVVGGFLELLVGEDMGRIACALPFLKVGFGGRTRDVSVEET